jgi:hypothetical protein
MLIEDDPAGTRKFYCDQDCTDGKQNASLIAFLVGLTLFLLFYCLFNCLVRVKRDYSSEWFFSEALQTSLPSDTSLMPQNAINYAEDAYQRGERILSPESATKLARQNFTDEHFAIPTGYNAASYPVGSQITRRKTSNFSLISKDKTGSSEDWSE